MPTRTPTKLPTPTATLLPLDTVRTISYPCDAVGNRLTQTIDGNLTNYVGARPEALMESHDHRVRV